ncbi:hypothetical protein [Roseimicrobium sp. ORNL1]|uniref:hypothetical protein n=1 Tax=Roseimicrobium sp. ORNL1 TaxID=2711231 RepID=UPI0013E0F32D|nr:hypothetical protein [Roseimicrobium sp. ORNL1]QIF01746.1 hypothetical protein G5S37_09490 [Roseimicrobium sp. ORNL1]
MKPMFLALLVGLAFGCVGLFLELFRVPGFSYETGYKHLQIFSSFFYSVRSKSDVVMSVFVLNGLLGTLLSWPITFLLSRK